MSEYLDEKVVSLKFDNQQFEKGANQSLNTIDKLKKSLNFTGASKGLDSLSSEASKLNSDFLSTASIVDGLSNKFSVMEIAAITAISRITNKVIDLGERLVMSLSVDQLSAGWAKYESKIASVQTIMAATATTWQESANAIGFAGTQMEYVSAMLDKLNWFSDETSYSFADMTNNIGKFTSSGIALDKSVEAMEGISVWAAKSGQNAQSASRAYYNLAQAISLGYVQLLDWKSIQSANMDTIEFKNTAIETAAAMGTLKKVSDGVYETMQGHEVTVQNFTNNLKDQWFTSDVLMKTLNEYGKATTLLAEIYDAYGVETTVFLGLLDDYNNGTLDAVEVNEKMGASIEEVIPLFEQLNSEEYKLSLTAFRAAQEAKTFTEVIDATRDAVSTGWMNTFELIFGNYEETKKLWSEMAEEFFLIFNGGAEGRNALLDKVMNDNWSQLIKIVDSAGISVETFSNKLTEELRNSGVPIDELIDKYGSLQEAIKHIDNIKEHIINVIKSFTSPITESAEVISDTTEKIEDLQKVVNSVIRGNFGNGATRIQKLTDAGYDYATVQGLINDIWERNGHTWNDTTISVEDLTKSFKNMSDEELESIGITREQADIMAELAEQAEITGTEMSDLLDNMDRRSGRELIFDSLLNIARAVRVAIEAIREAWNETFPNQDKAVDKIIGGFHKFTSWLILSGDALENFKTIFKGVFSLFGLIGDIIGAFVRTFFPEFSYGLGTIGGGLAEILVKISEGIMSFREFAKEGDLFGQIFQYLKEMFGEGVSKITEWMDKIGEIPIIGTILEKVIDIFKKVYDKLLEIWDEFYDELTYGSGNIISAFERMFKKIGDEITGLFKKIPYIDKIKESLTKFFTYFTNSGKNIVMGLIQGLKSFDYKQLWNIIVDIASKMVQVFCDFMGIHSPATRWIELAVQCCAGLITGFASMINTVGSAITKFVKAIFDKLNKDAEDDKISPFKFIENIAKKTGEKIVDIFGVVINTLGKIFGGIHKMFVDKNFFNKVMSGLRAIFSVLLMFNAVRITNAIPVALINFSTSLKRISKSIKKYFTSLSVKNYAVIARNLTLAVAMIALAVYGLSKLPKEQFEQAITALKMFEEIIIALGMVMAATIFVSGITSKTYAFTKYKTFMTKAGQAIDKTFTFESRDKVKAANSSIIQMAGLILAVGASLWLFVEAFKNLVTIISDPAIKDSNIAAALGILAGIFVVLMGGSIIAGKLASAANTALLGLAAILIAITGSMYLVLLAAKMFFLDDASEFKINLDSWQNIAKFIGSITTISLIILGLIGAIKLLSSIASGMSLASGTSLAVMLMSVGLSLYLILGSVSTLVNNVMKIWLEYKDTVGTNPEDQMKMFDSIAGLLAVVFAGLVAVMIVIFAGLSILGSALKKAQGEVLSFFSASLFLAVFAAALYAMVETLNRLDAVITTMKNPFATLISFVIGFGLLIGAIIEINKNKINSANWNLILIAGMLVALGYAVSLTSKIEDPDRVYYTISALTIAVGALTLLVGILNDKSSFEYGAALSNAVQLIALAGLMLSLGWSLKQLESYDIGHLITVALTIGALIGALMIIGSKLADVNALFESLPIAVIAGAIWVVAKALAALYGTLQDDSMGAAIGKLVAIFIVIGALITGLYGLAAAISTSAAEAAIGLIIILGIAGAIFIVSISISAVLYTLNELIKTIDNIIQRHGGIIQFIKDVADAIGTVIVKVKELVDWLMTLLKYAPYVIGTQFDITFGKHKIKNDTDDTNNTNNRTPVYAIGAIGGGYYNYSYKPGNSSNETVVGQNAGILNITDQLNEQLDNLAIDMSPYQNQITDQISGMTDEITNSIKQIPFGEQIIDGLDLKDKMYNITNGIMDEMDLNEAFDTSELRKAINEFDLNMGDLNVNMGDYTSLLGDYTNLLGNSVDTLETLAEKYKDYKLEDSTPLQNPDTIKKDKEWKAILEETGYATQEEYIEAYNKYLHDLQWKVNPDDIKFTEVATKDAYVEAYNNYLGYLDYLEQDRENKVNNLLSDYLYLNADKRYASDQLVEYVNTEIKKYKVDDEHLENFVDNLIEKFYDQVYSTLVHDTGTRPYNSPNFITEETGTITQKVIPSYSSGGGSSSIYGNLFSTSSSEAMTIKFPDNININDERIVKAIAANAKLFGQDIAALGDRISQLQVVLDSQILVGQLSPKISRRIADNTANYVRGM